MNNHLRLLLRLALLGFFVLSFVYQALSKEAPVQTITWPESGAAVLKFTFGKFKELGSLGGQRSYMTETTAANLWTKPISSATFSLYLYDKNKTRIGEGYISLNNVGPGQPIKFDTSHRNQRCAGNDFTPRDINAPRACAAGSAQEGVHHH